MLNNVHSHLITVIETQREKNRWKQPKSLRQIEPGWNEATEMQRSINMSVNASMHDQYPSKVQVSVEETPAERCDPGENCSPLYIVSNNPERETERER